MGRTRRRLPQAPRRTSPADPCPGNSGPRPVRIYRPADDASACWAKRLTTPGACPSEGPGRPSPSTVLGPFHVVESPARALGDNIDLVGTGVPCVVTGRVVSVDGSPLPGATLDVWQANDQGFYDVQQPDRQPRANGRGLFTADGGGEFWFRTIVPSYYPIPTDGPVGELLNATGRHAFRPAHIHFIVTAPGHRDL